MPGEGQPSSARRRWAIAWSVRVAFVVVVAAAAWVANRVFDSGWVALAVGCLVLTTPLDSLPAHHASPAPGRAGKAGGRDDSARDV